MLQYAVVLNAAYVTLVTLVKVVFISTCFSTAVPFKTHNTSHRSITV